MDRPGTAGGDCARKVARRPDRPQDALPVAQRDTKLFKIAICQIRQHVAVDRIFDEYGLVFFKSDFLQPVADVHRTALSFSRAVVIPMTKLCNSSLFGCGSTRDEIGVEVLTNGVASRGSLGR